MKISRRCVACGNDRLGRSPAVLMPFVAFRVFGWESVAVTPDWGLRDLAPGQAHALCATLSCAECGLLFLDMRFDAEEMATLYADYRGPEYRVERERFEPGYGRRNDLLEAGTPSLVALEALLAPLLAATPSILDWGGDTGVNTPLKGRAGLHHVHDISDKPLLPGAERVARDAIRPGAYDLVVSSHVLEHVAEPAALLAEMAAVLGSASILYVEVPHEAIVREVDDPARRAALKRHWHEHVNFFTREALAAMAARAGLRVETLLTREVEAGGRSGHVFSLVCRRA